MTTKGFSARRSQRVSNQIREEIAGGVAIFFSVQQQEQLSAHKSRAGLCGGQKPRLPDIALLICVQPQFLRAKLDFLELKAYS